MKPPISSSPLIAAAGQEDDTLTAEDLQEHHIGSLKSELPGSALTLELEASGLRPTIS
jgi:hypothetical protein